MKQCWLNYHKLNPSPEAKHKQHFTSQYFILQTEIMQFLDVIMSKYSYKSSSNNSDLLSKMFSDSSIAKDFACGKAECSYIVKSELSPYFLELLNSELNNASHCVALLDEPYNNEAKEFIKWIYIFVIGTFKIMLWHNFMALIFRENLQRICYMVLKLVLELFLKKKWYKSLLMVPP